MGLKKFWNGRKVFISGITGFKGSWLSAWLNVLGAEVKGYSLIPEDENSLFYLLNINKCCSTIFGDVRDEEYLLKAIDEFKPEVIFHLAAQPLVQESYSNPKETYEINLMGTINMLESALKCNSVKSFVNVTSDKVYENKEWEWGYRENERLNGSDPYSNSKSCADLIASCYKKSFLQDNFKLANVRSGNVIGGGDWAKDRLIPDMIRAQLKNEVMVLRNPKSTRPWQHVLEPLYGYLLVAQRMLEEGGFDTDWNFGPDHTEDASVEKIAESYNAFWSTEAQVATKPDAYKEAKYLRLDSSKANNLLGWKSIWNLKDTLQKTFIWYDAFLKELDMKKVTLDQINEYQEMQEKR